MPMLFWLPLIFMNALSKWRLRHQKCAKTNRPEQPVAMTEGSRTLANITAKAWRVLSLANLSDVPDVQARWLMMSQTWFKLAQKADDPSSQSNRSNVVPLKSR